MTTVSSQSAEIEQEGECEQSEGEPRKGAVHTAGAGGSTSPQPAAAPVSCAESCTAVRAQVPPEIVPKSQPYHDELLRCTASGASGLKYIRA